jgi:hypothetical protein
MALVKYNNNSISAVTSAASMPSGAMTHIKTLTASSSGTLSFVNGSSDVVLDSTYPIYMFKFINIHPSASANLEFNATTDGTNYNIVKTSTAFYTTHRENGSSGALGYSGIDEAQATGFQQLTTGDNVATDNDASIVGELHIFNPSNTTFVKHFISKTNFMGVDGSNKSSNGGYVAGYFNTTTALTGFQFKMRSGNLDAATIKLYGIKDS